MSKKALILTTIFLTLFFLLLSKKIHVSIFESSASINPIQHRTPMDVREVKASPCQEIMDSFSSINFSNKAWGNQLAAVPAPPETRPAKRITKPDTLFFAGMLLFALGQVTRRILIH